MSAFDDLLAVQDHDTAADRLRHRRDNLPELGELASIEEAGAKVTAAMAEAAERAGEIGRRQRKLEDDLASTESRIAEIEKRMYSGVVSVPRELQAMQADVASLRRRRSDLEEEVLGVMTEAEPVDADLARLQEERDHLDGEGARLRGVIAEMQVDIDGQLALETEARQKAAAGLPPELSQLYEQLRAKLGGVGAARFVNGRCDGCHLSLPATEVDRIRHESPDALIRCDQCGRILVRT